MKTLLKKVRDKFNWPMLSAISKLEAPCMGSLQIQQKILALKYRELAEKGLSLPPLHETEYRVYSRNGEDGILAFLFSLVGTEHKRFLKSASRLESSVMPQTLRSVTLGMAGWSRVTRKWQK